MLLETTTYSAFRGYSWSSIPVCAPQRKLDQLYRMISKKTSTLRVLRNPPQGKATTTRSGVHAVTELPARQHSSMLLETTTYSAFRGYSWSSIPVCAPQRKLDQLYRMISAARGDFPDPFSIETGLVSDGATVAVFTVQNIERWDSEQRASDYAALAVFPVEQAVNIDFVELLSRDFFWTPSRNPEPSLDYLGKPSAPVPMPALKELMTKQQASLDNPSAIGSILSACGYRSPRWICLMKDGILKVECDKWT